ncbi:MAG: hypothetical protein DRP64_00030 [Verrucomicrobia bacterium]|nr:MAG: hypothetical protein DRP64_00030 [Verrucomicrobiota bacterium]
MSKTTYPKRGKKQSPGVRTVASTNHSERNGSPYYFRPELGDTDEEQMLRRMSFYGKESPVEAPDHQGAFVNPARTMIRG